MNVSLVNVKEVMERPVVYEYEEPMYRDDRGGGRPNRAYDYVLQEEQPLPDRGYDYVLQEEEPLPDRAYDYVSEEQDTLPRSFTRDPYSSRVWQSRGRGLSAPDNVGRSIWRPY